MVRRLCAAQRFFCAALILALASGDIARFWLASVFEGEEAGVAFVAAGVGVSACVAAADLRFAAQYFFIRKPTA